MLKWITWNRTALAFKLYTYAKLNCLKQNCFDIQLCVNKKLYLYEIELFEIELFICIKMDLVLIT